MNEAIGLNMSDLNISYSLVTERGVEDVIRICGELRQDYLHGYIAMIIMNIALLLLFKFGNDDMKVCAIYVVFPANLVIGILLTARHMIGV